MKRPNSRSATPPASLETPISPPPSGGIKVGKSGRVKKPSKSHPKFIPNLAAVEAGEIRIRDHLECFSEHLKSFVKASPKPPLSIPDLAHLYDHNQHPDGHHFVVHQHDHPVAGLHYDLRLQISETGSISWAIMYGLPGDPNSMRLNRNATETRVHNLWNHLIETASASTGSMLIWDAGEYSVLPWRESSSRDTDDKLSSASDAGLQSPIAQLSEPQKLYQAFQNRRIRLRLQGTRLPRNYTISLRLLSENNRFTQPERPAFKRRRTSKPSRSPLPQRNTPPPSSDDIEDLGSLANNEDHDIVPSITAPATIESIAYERELQELEDETVRRTNAYPGAENSIGSIHQRRWYLSLDRRASGFIPTSDKRNGRRQWVRRISESGEGLGFAPFYVRGRNVEKSVVTGRVAGEVLRDEGVEVFQERKGWRPVLE